MKLTVREIVAACGGKLLCGDENTEITSVSTDSRKVAEGTLFIPLKGERTDAHSYISATFASGASATLTEEHTEMEDCHPWISVPSTQTALQLLATAYRKRFTIPVVGITGSVGKTTTKEMVALALSSQWSVMKTEGNFNSQIGLPLTLFQLKKGHQAAIVEMGMSNFGEMGRLTEIASPDYAVITNIGISHIQQLGTQENILQEKLHIIDRFHTGSVLFLNGDDEILAGLRGKLAVKTVYFGTQPWCECRADSIQFVPEGVSFTFWADGKQMPVFLPALGIHNVTNALASLAVTRTLGLDLEKAADKLREYHPLAMRQQIHRNTDGITVIDDSYNASPDAINGSVDVLCTLREQDGRCAAVLADMLELGELEHAAHYAVGEHVAESGVDLLITVGERAKVIAQGACSVNPDICCEVCKDNTEAIAVLNHFLRCGDVLLVKGSRAMHTDEIVKAVL